MAKKKKIKINGDFFIDVFVYAFATFVFVVTLYPFLNVLAISFNESSDTVRGGIYVWPRIFTLQNYEKLFDYPNIPRAAVNSVVRTVLGTVLGLFFTSITAYAVSRKDYIFRKPIMVLFLVAMYVNGGLIPGYLLIRSIGLMNSFWVYIIPGLIGIFNVILMRSFMDTLPLSLQESAMLDGASDFYIYSRIIMPLSLPSIATIALFLSVGHWNDWFTAYLYNSRRPENTLLQYELQKVIADTFAQQAPPPDATSDIMRQKMADVTPKSIQMAIMIVVTTPILMVYPFIQKYFIKGMLIGSLKG